MRAMPALIAAIACLAAPMVAAAAGLQVTSPAFKDGAAIPSRYSSYGENKIPTLSWTPVPGAKAYAIALWDPDAQDAHPFVHWVAWNVPGSAHALPEGGLPGLVQGRNSLGRSGYFGPHPPSGTHHYHFQVFALSTPLNLPGNTDLAGLKAAMKGHELAEGELVGTFAH